MMGRKVQRDGRLLWWLKPHILVFLLYIPMLVAALALDQDWYARFAGARKFMHGEEFFIGMAGVLAFAGFSWFFGRSSAPRQKAWPDASWTPLVDQLIFRQTLWVLFFIVLGAYAIWFSAFILNPKLVLVLASGQLSQGYGRDLAPTVAGITTLTQLGIPLVILGMVQLGPRLRRVRWSDPVVVMVVTILVLSLLRSFIRSERLAFIELMVPVGVLWVAYRAPRTTFWRILPFVAVGGLIAMFGIFEFYRSWLHYYSGKETDFFGFFTQRLFLYYVTALNNGAGMINVLGTLHGPDLTAEWFWRFPLPFAEALEQAEIEKSFQRWRFLYSYASPEFNNLSGVYSVFYDYGVPLGVVVFGALGAVTGKLYKQFVHGRLLGVILFPAWFTGLLEMPRVFTWGSSRFFPALVLILVLAWFAHQALSDTRRMPARAPFP